MKRCRRCKKVKPGEMFSKDKSQADGLLGYCKDCDRERQRGRVRRRCTECGKPCHAERCMSCYREHRGDPAVAPYGVDSVVSRWFMRPKPEVTSR